MLSVITKIKIEGPDPLVDQALDDIINLCKILNTTLESTVKTDKGESVLISYRNDAPVWNQYIKDVSRKYPALKFENWVYIYNGWMDDTAFIMYISNGNTYSSHERGIQDMNTCEIQNELFGKDMI